MTADRQDEGEQADKLSPPVCGGTFIVDKRRWTVLATFCLLNLANALTWVTYSPISDLSERYFGASTTQINTLAVVFLVVFPFGAVVEVVLMKRYGLSRTLLVGAVLTAVGALLRYIVAALHEASPLPSSVLYGVTLLGQLLAAIAQPLFVNVPAHLSSSWFPTHERDLSTTLGAMFSPIGNAVGQLLPVLLVSQSGGPGTPVSGMPALTLAEFVICAASAALSHWLVTDAPPTPPSASASASSSAVAQGTAHSHSSSSSSSGGAPPPLGRVLQTLWLETKALATDRDYRVLWVTFSLALGVFNAVLTLVNQLVQPWGYSNDDAGICGIALIIVGLLGAGAVSVLLEKTKAYRETIKYGYLCAFAAMVLMCCMLRPNNLGGLVFSFALLGFFLLPMLPASYEACSEFTYGLAPADMSVGLLLVGGNVAGIPLTYVLGDLATRRAWGPPPWTPSNCFMIVVVGAASALLFLLKGEYKRQQAEGSAAGAGGGGGGGGGDGGGRDSGEAGKDSPSGSLLGEPLLRINI